MSCPIHHLFMGLSNRKLAHLKSVDKNQQCRVYNCGITLIYMYISFTGSRSILFLIYSTSSSLTESVKWSWWYEWAKHWKHLILQSLQTLVTETLNVASIHGVRSFHLKVLGTDQKYIFYPFPIWMLMFLPPTPDFKLLTPISVPHVWKCLMLRMPTSDNLSDVGQNVLYTMILGVIDVRPTLMSVTFACHLLLSLSDLTDSVNHLNVVGMMRLS